jgi:hypothetical protein
MAGGLTVAPKDAHILVPEGDPTKEGPIVYRATDPEGYRIRPHFIPRWIGSRFFPVHPTTA